MEIGKFHLQEQSQRIHGNTKNILLLTHLLFTLNFTAFPSAPYLLCSGTEYTAPTRREPVSWEQLQEPEDRSGLKCGGLFGEFAPRPVVCY